MSTEIGFPGLSLSTSWLNTSLRATLPALIYACLLPHEFVAVAAAASVPASAISPDLWTSLSKSVQGRLYSDGVPFSQPCFPVYEAQNNTATAAACQAIQTGYLKGDVRLSHFGAFSNPQWETCQATSSGCLLDWQNPSNTAAYVPPKECSQGSVSKYYVDIREPDDVRAVFAFAERTGVRLAIKNTGHDYIGRSSAPDSLTLWTRNLQGLSYDPDFVPEGCSTASPGVTMGAGTVFKQLYQFAEENGITIVGGTDRTVGAAGGWVQGGGHSMLSNVFGLGADRVLQYKVVTPTGRYLTANACSNSDLFFALRGGGGGTFGVVLEATFRAEPKPVVLQIAKIIYTATSDNWVAALKVGAENAIRLSGEGWSGLINTGNVLLINPLLSLEQAKVSFQPFADLAARLNGTFTIETKPSWLSFFDSYIAGNPIGMPGTPASRLVPRANFETDASRAELLDAIIQGTAPAHFKQIIINNPVNYGGNPAETSVTPAWRNTLWQVTTGYFWNFGTSVDGVKSAYAASSEAIRRVHEITPGSGTYHAEADVHEPDHEFSFWGSNYDALLTIKKKYDPSGLLDCWHCVGWTDSSDGRYSCHV